MSSTTRQCLLIFPPQHCLEESMRLWTFSYAANFPLALLRMSTHLKSRGHEVRIVDAFNVHDNTPESMHAVLSETRIVRMAPCGNFASEKRYKPVYHVGLTWEQLESALRNGNPPDEIYVSSIFTWSWETTHRTVALAARLFPRATITVGGVYPTLCPEPASRCNAQVFQGRMPELDHVWLDADALQAVRQLDGVVLKTSTGCPNSCSYCAVHLLEGRKVQFRDPLNVLDELDYLHDRLHLNRVFFWESNLLMKSERHIATILRGISERRRNWALQAPEGLQPDLITADLAHLLRQTGFREIRLTQETTDATRLAQSGRPSGLADVERAATLLMNAGFSSTDIFVVLLIGQPGQKMTTILRDILRIYRLGLQTTFLVYTPIPRTRDFEMLKNSLTRPLEDLDSFLFPCSSEQLTVAQLDGILRFFNNRWFPVSRISASETDEPIIRTMKELIDEEQKL